MELLSQLFLVLVMLGLTSILFTIMCFGGLAIVSMINQYKEMINSFGILTEGIKNKSIEIIEKDEEDCEYKTEELSDDVAYYA